jgi:hydroxymethylbilane synthase
MPTLKIGTRGSQLALFQANTVKTLLQQRAGAAAEIVVIKTSGDRLAEATLSEIGGKRLFVKEIEDALLAGTIDLAVHSSKDMPVVLPEGLALGAVLPREDPRDAVVLPGSPAVASMEEMIRVLGQSPRIGTSSVRRSAQLSRLFPGASFLPIRGNLDTRLRKLDAGDFDALVLAAAGLLRLQYGRRISAFVPVDACVPAPGQGIIAVEIRGGDARLLELVGAINDPVAATALAVERVVVQRLGGGCQMPLGALAEISGDRITVRGIVVSPDGAQAAHATAEGSARDPEQVGIDAAERLLAEGAGAILADVMRAQAAVEGLQP